MDVDIHIQRVAQSIESQHGVTSVEPLKARRISENRAVIRLKVTFFDESLLVMEERVDTSSCFPVFVHYGYQYIKNSQQVFRYDNAHAYPDLPTNPCHKHVGPDETGKIEASNRPSYNQLFREIRRFLDLPE